MVNVLVNGEETELDNGLTVAGLVETLGLKSRRVAVELNRDVLSRERWQETTLRERDQIEIVQFVGGG
ncbi:MAG: sulfur carrier protein ThiS [Myxococcales bacterium]|nr:MAG: sulfur carrier protein ThiS [Myxococcales bacterium]